MKAVLQVVNSAKCEVENKIVGEINKGYVIYLGISKDYTLEKGEWICNKLLNLRTFTSQEKGFDLSIEDITGEILIISQFTLFGDCKKGKKPNFSQSCEYELAKQHYEKFIKLLREKTNLKIQTGVFGAHMKITQENNGPITLILEK